MKRSDSKTVPPGRAPWIAREGWPLLAALALVTAAVAIWQPWAALLPAALLLLVAWFFRDPERQAPAAAQVVVAAADGRVTAVREVDEPRFLGGRALMVSIFLSVFDVHVNRAPVAGTVAYKDYVPGKFVAAWADRVEEVNERQYLGLETVDGRRVLVAQIAGLVARRIVCRPEPGDTLQRGERFGLIKFGSCTQVYLPPDAIATVRPGDRVRGGETPLGRLPD